MKHIFLINPAAGKKGNAESIIRPQIEDYCGKEGLDYEIYVTKCQGDAQNYCREHAKSGEALRFYACGGDGTLYAVVNGAYGYPNCEVAVIPLGSGNDFVRRSAQRSSSAMSRLRSRVYPSSLMLSSAATR